MSDETKAIEETAKAAPELAKTGSKAIDATRDVGGRLYCEKREVPDYVRNKEHRYSSGIGADDPETAVLFYRLGLILPVHVTVEEYPSQRPVMPSWDRDARGPYYVDDGDKALVLGDLSVVGLTEFGEKFCKAVIGDVSGLYKPRA